MPDQRRQIPLCQAARSPPAAQLSTEPVPRRRLRRQSPRKGEREAAGELERAISLYDEEPRPGQCHGVAGKALAGTDLAIVRLRSGALDAAQAALEPVLSLPPAQRVATLTTRLARVREELAAPVFRGSQQARDLGGQIEEFYREAVTAGLHSLSG